MNALWDATANALFSATRPPDAFCGVRAAGDSENVALRALALAWARSGETRAMAKRKEGNSEGAAS